MKSSGKFIKYTQEPISNRVQEHVLTKTSSNTELPRQTISQILDELKDRNPHAHNRIINQH